MRSLHRCRYRSENASAYATPEAVECLALRAHVKGRRFLLMEWAKGLEICSRSFERKIGTDHLDNVVRRRDLFDSFSWDCSHETLDFSLVCFGKRCQTYAVRSGFPNITKRVPIFIL